jgi:uncharacterized membrane protein
MRRMRKIVLPWLAVLAVMLVLDALWLGVVARSLYVEAIGHLMADSPNLVAAAVFYPVYAAGLAVFGVRVMEPVPPAWPRAMRGGALFGFFAYATYDLTNLATLQGWPVGIALLDMAWGTLVSGASAAAGSLARHRLAPSTPAG